MHLTALALCLAAVSTPSAAPVREKAVIELPGRRLEALIQRPDEPRSRRRPALVVIGGLETGARVLDLLPPDSPVVLATFEYQYEGPRRFRFPRTLLDAPRIKAAAAGTPADVLALRSFLEKQPYVDPGRLCVVGASFGAPFALRAAADDARLRCLVLVEGFADVEGTARHRMRQLWGSRLGPLARPLSWLTARALGAYLDWPAPEEDAPRLRESQRVLVIEAAGDTLLPAASRRLLWDSLRRSRAKLERVIVPGEHLLAGRSRDDIERISRIVLRWLETGR